MEFLLGLRSGDDSCAWCAWQLCRGLSHEGLPESRTSGRNQKLPQMSAQDRKRQEAARRCCVIKVASLSLLGFVADGLPPGGAASRGWAVLALRGGRLMTGTVTRAPSSESAPGHRSSRDGPSLCPYGSGGLSWSGPERVSALEERVRVLRGGFCPFTLSG